MKMAVKDIPVVNNLPKLLPGVSKAFGSGVLRRSGILVTVPKWHAGLW